MTQRVLGLFCEGYCIVISAALRKIECQKSIKKPHSANCEVIAVGFLKINKDLLDLCLFVLNVLANRWVKLHQHKLFWLGAFVFGGGVKMTCARCGL